MISGRGNGGEARARARARRERVSPRSASGRPSRPLTQLEAELSWGTRCLGDVGCESGVRAILNGNGGAITSQYRDRFEAAGATGKGEILVLNLSLCARADPHPNPLRYRAHPGARTSVAQTSGFPIRICLPARGSGEIAGPRGSALPPRSRRRLPGALWSVQSTPLHSTPLQSRPIDRMRLAEPCPGRWFPRPFPGLPLSAGGGNAFTQNSHPHFTPWRSRCMIAFARSQTRPLGGPPRYQASPPTLSAPTPRVGGDRRLASGHVL